MSGRHQSSARSRTARYFPILAFAALYAVAAILWRVPAWVGGVYVGASVVAFAMYAIDKSAAKRNRWRISEAALLAIGLIGGWPGAVLAQQLLRHKTSKPSFRAAFWGTVVINVAAFVFFASPLAKQLLPA